MTKIEATALLATCEALARKSWDERNEIEPNPDISGPGVSAKDAKLFHGTEIEMHENV